MTYLDSNIIIRIITGDTPELAEELLATIEQSKKNEFYISATVLVEVCFVLEFHDYAMLRADIYKAINTLISAPQLNISEDAAYALNIYKKFPKLDFTDCYLLALAKQNNAKVLTLDKDLQKSIDNLVNKN